MRLNKRGFSLVELILVMAIILVIIAIGTPYILRSMQTAYDASAVAYLRQMQRAQENYRVVNGEYADSFSQLEPYLTSEFAPSGLPLSPFPRLVLAHAGPVPLQVGAPPGQGGTPPGQGGTPPGQGGTPPGQGGTPPGQGSTPPGQGGTPPGQGGTPPGQGGTPLPAKVALHQPRAALLQAKAGRLPAKVPWHLNSTNRFARCISSG